MLLFPLLPRAAWGSGADFVFHNRGDISGWRFEHVEEARFTGGGLLLKGNNNIRIGPPNDFRTPAGRVVMELRFRSPKSLIINVRVKAADGWQAFKTVRVKVIDGNNEDTVLRVYLGKHGGGGQTYINDFVIDFYSTEKIAVRLDGLRFYEPGTMGLAALYWGEFWTPDFITGTTVGAVTTPEAGGVGFISMLYILIGLAFITVLIVYRVRGHGLSSPKASSVLIALFLSGGVLFTLRMDYNWMSIFRDDVNTLSQVDVEKRIRLVNQKDLDSFFDFIDFVKESVPLGRGIRPATVAENTPLAAIARYYLLPLEDSPRDADFLWSYAEVLRLDPYSGALYDGKGKLIVPRARLFAEFAGNAAIYEVIK